nr:hypothetical protein [Bradyrhizobium centrolobii]
MHKVTWDTAGVEGRFDPRALPIEQASANLDIFFAVKISYLTCNRPMACDQEVIPVREILFENKTGFCPSCFISGGAKIIANRSHHFWRFHTD